MTTVALGSVVQFSPLARMQGSLTQGCRL